MCNFEDYSYSKKLVKYTKFSCMAKTRSIVTHDMTGTLAGMTFVNSKRYKNHARCARGTHKEAVLNEAMEQSSERLASANKPAKVIFDAVRNDHKSGGLWTKLLSIFRKQMKAGLPFDVSALKDLECHEEHKLDKLIGYSACQLAVEVADGQLAIAVTMQEHPSWKKKEYINGYQVTITVVYPDFENWSFIKETVYGPVTDLNKDKPEPLQLTVPAPPTTTTYVVFMTVTGCIKGEPAKEEHLKGMRVMDTGRIKISAENTGGC